MRATVLVLSSVVVAIGMGLGPHTSIIAQRTSANIVISTLSSRPDLVSGGDALVEIRMTAPITDDVMKCQLKPIDPKDYAVTFTPAQMRELQGIFPNGVCDYTKPGVGQGPPAGTYLKLPLK